MFVTIIIIALVICCCISLGIMAHNQNVYEAEKRRLVDKILAQQQKEMFAQQWAAAAKAAKQQQSYRTAQQRRPQSTQYELADRLLTSYGGFKKAVFATHPDRGGNPDDFKRVMLAKQILDRGF